MSPINLVLIFASFLVSVFVSEVVLRIAIAPPVTWEFPQESYIYDPYIGHRLVPGQRSFTHDKPVVINSAGIRDAEYSLEPDAGVYRLLAIGDSQTFGNGVESEDTWPKQLEAELNRTSSGRKYEVLNCGIPGTDVWQHEILLKRMLELYRVDGVILAFYVNDAVIKPHKIRQNQGIKSHSFRMRASRLLKQSALVIATYSAIKAIRIQFWPSQSYLHQKALLMGETSPEVLRRWGQVDESIAGMKKLSEEYSSDFMVISLPRRDQVSGSMTAETYNSRLATIAMRNNVRLIEMLGPLQLSYKEYGKRLFIPWDGHNSVIANRVIAVEAVTEILATRFANRRN